MPNPIVTVIIPDVPEHPNTIETRIAQFSVIYTIKLTADDVNKDGTSIEVPTIEAQIETVERDETHAVTKDGQIQADRGDNIYATADDLNALVPDFLPTLEKIKSALIQKYLDQQAKKKG